MKKQTKSGEWMVRLKNGNIIKCDSESEADIARALSEEGPPVGSICALVAAVFIFIGYLLGVI